MKSSGTHGAKASFEITNGERQLVTLSEADVERCLDLRELLDGLEDGFRSFELGEVQTPARTQVTVPGKGFSLTMAAWRPGMAIAVKVVNVFEANLELGLPNHLATINLYDPDTGEVLGVVNMVFVKGTKESALTQPSGITYAVPSSHLEQLLKKLR